MKTAFVLAVALAIVSCVFASNVIDLTPDNFDQYVDGSRGAFVEFYAPWCGHCKRLAPDYEIVANTFANSKDVIIAKVDADEHKSLGSRFGIQGFPTLKWFPKGSTEPEDYSGGRSVDDIVNFVNEKAGTRGRVSKPESQITQLTTENFDEVVLDSSKDVVVEFYAPWCGHCKSFLPEYEKVAAAFKNEEGVVIAQIDADKYRDIGQRYDVKGFPTIKFFPRDAKDAPVDVEIARTTDAYVQYVNEKTGARRKTDGSLESDAGRQTELDALAAKFVAAGADERATLIGEAEAISRAVTGRYSKHAQYYVKAMNSINTKGAEFIGKERARLQRMIAGGAIKPQAVDDFTARSNILSAFE